MPHHGHLMWGLVYVLVFSAGQLLFMLKRADLARRSPLNGVKSIGQFFALNWVALLFRSVIEWGVVLWPYRSANEQFIQDLVHKVWSTFPFQIPARRGLIGCFFLGVGADLLLDWLAMQPWIAKVPVLNMIRENIPQLPQVQQLVSTLAPKEAA